MNPLKRLFFGVLMLIGLSIGLVAQTDCIPYGDYGYDTGSCTIGGRYELCREFCGDTGCVYLMCYEDASVCESSSGSIIISTSAGCVILL